MREASGKPSPNLVLSSLPVESFEFDDSDNDDMRCPEKSHALVGSGPSENILNALDMPPLSVKR